MDLSHFRAGSANDEKHPELWEQQAKMFIQQLIDLTPVEPKILDIFSLEDNIKARDLSSLFQMYGSDKCSVHHQYHLLYAHLLAKLDNNPKKILEIGIGTNNPELVSTMGIAGHPGASLRAFRDFLPNTEIVGADVDKECLFEEERIHTCFTDQLSLLTLHSTLGNMGPYDMIIDDGLHAIGANINVILFGLEHIASPGFLVIEDIDFRRMPLWKTIDSILRHKYMTYFVKDVSCMVYVIET